MGWSWSWFCTKLKRGKGSRNENIKKNKNMTLPKIDRWLGSPEALSSNAFVFSSNIEDWKKSKGTKYYNADQSKKMRLKRKKNENT